MADVDIPAGFAPIFRTSPFLETIGPLYSTGSGALLVIGMRVQEKHTNARGTLHGGVLASVADIALGYGLAQGLAAGLVDVKVCAIDQVWSGLKLVIRKELR